MKPIKYRALSVLSAMAAVIAAVGCAPSKPPAAAIAVDPVDFETMEQDMQYEAGSLSSDGTAKFFEEAYSFAEKDRGLSRDADRERYVLDLMKKENAIDFFVACRQLYRFAKSDRNLQTDAARIQFAEKWAAKEYPFEAAAIWMDAYRFAKEERKLTSDGSDAFATSNFDSKEPRIFWKNYRGAYLLAKNKRRLRDDLAHRFAVDIATQAVEQGG